jgi:hypothetical protein
MCRAIDVAYRTDEVKEIRNKAVAIEHYARQAKNTEAERQACEIRLRAERKYGQLDAEMNPTSKTKGGRGKKALRGKTVSKQQAAKWRRLGKIPQKDFDEALNQAEKPTTSGVIRVTTAPKVNPVSPEALWLWGRLRDFNRDLLSKDPSDVLSTMTPEMLDEVHTLAPRVAAWLKRIGSTR